MNGLPRSCTKPSRSGGGPGGEVDENFGFMGMEDPMQVSSIFRQIGKGLAYCELDYPSTISPSSE